MKKLLYLLLAGFIFVSLAGCGQSSVNNGKDSSSVRDSSGDDSAPQYSFALDGYVEIQKGEVDKFNLKDYLPEGLLIVTQETHMSYTDEVDETSEYYFQNNGNNTVDSWWTSSLAPDSYTSWGTMYYDEELDCLAKKQSLFGIDSDNPYLIQTEKTYYYDKDKTEYLEMVPYYFNVNCKAGEFEKCIAVLHIVPSGYNNTVDFYAPNVGKILSVMEVDGKFILYMETTEVFHDTDEVTTEYEENKQEDVSSEIDMSMYYSIEDDFTCDKANDGNKYSIKIQSAYDGDTFKHFTASVSDGMTIYFHPVEEKSDSLVSAVYDDNYNVLGNIIYYSDEKKITIVAKGFNSPLYDYVGDYYKAGDNVSDDIYNGEAWENVTYDGYYVDEDSNELTLYNDGDSVMFNLSVYRLTGTDDLKGVYSGEGSRVIIDNGVFDGGQKFKAYFEKSSEAGYVDFVITESEHEYVPEGTVFHFQMIENWNP